MTKTTKAISIKRGYFHVDITAAIVAALSGLTTVEELDFSSVVEVVEQVQEAASEIAEDFVIGDDDPIVTMDASASAEKYKVTMFYTQGKETLGTDSVDPYTDVIRAIREHTSPLPVQFLWAVGGNTGDEEEATSATDCYISSISKPVPAASGSGKVRVTFNFTTPKTVVSVIA